MFSSDPYYGDVSKSANYIPVLPYEQPYTQMAKSDEAIHVNQDALMIDGINRRNQNTSDLRAAGTMEGAAFARYRLALRNYLNIVTGPGSWIV